MNSKNLTLIIILLVILLFGGCACGRYNGLVTSDQVVKTAWSDVETNYQRRTDLYNSVIKVIEGSANFEKSTLTAVIAARANATAVHVDVNDSASLGQYQRAQAQLQGSFSRLMAVAEAYPDLKTTQQFQNFQTQIEGTENRINVARRDFNAAVQDYNLKVKTFPNNIFAGIFGFHEKPYYKSDPGSENAPDIHFDIK
jgi:LemA protein